jgi:hypothetical protein
MVAAPMTLLIPGAGPPLTNIPSFLGCMLMTSPWFLLAFYLVLQNKPQISPQSA